MQSVYNPNNTINYPVMNPMMQDSLDYAFQVGQPQLDNQMTSIGINPIGSSQPQMHPTYIPIPEQARMSLVAILNQLVCDCISLTYSAKQAHWNIKGKDFIAIHRLFDEVFSLGNELVDTFAETGVTIGGQATGTIDHAVKVSRLAPFPLLINDSHTLIIEVTERLAAISQYLSEAISQTESLDKTIQNDLMTAQSKVNKMIYFLESHLH